MNRRRIRQGQVRPDARNPVAKGLGTRLECNLRPRDLVRGEGPRLQRLVRGDGFTTDDACLIGDHDHRRLNARVQAYDPNRLDLQAGLLERLADRRLEYGLIALEEDARLGPPVVAGGDSTPDQHNLA